MLGSAAAPYVLALLLAMGAFAYMQMQRVSVAHAQQSLMSAQITSLEQANAESAAAVAILQADLADRSQVNAQLQAARTQLREHARRATARIQHVDVGCARQRLPGAVLEQLCQFAGARADQDGLRPPAGGVDAGAGCASAAW